MEIWKSISEFVSIWPLLLSLEVQETRILTAGESEELKLLMEFLAKNFGYSFESGCCGSCHF